MHQDKTFRQNPPLENKTESVKPFPHFSIWLNVDAIFSFLSLQAHFAEVTVESYLHNNRYLFGGN